MITLTILLIVLVIAAIIAAITIGIGGAAIILVFGDVIICGLIVYHVLKKLFRKKTDKES